MTELELKARELLRRFPLIDGTPDVTVGLEDVSAYPALFAELLRRGWTEPDCAARAGGNLLRVLRAAESFAAR